MIYEHNSTDNPYLDLANAIVKQAVYDYRLAILRIKRRKVPRTDDKDKDYWEVESLKRFFNSQWFTELSDLDGEVLLIKLNEELGV